MPVAIGWMNGVVPVAGLMALAVLLPILFGRWIGLGQMRLMVVMLGVALVIWAIGAGVLAALTLNEGGSVAAGALAFLARSTKMALAWGPVWALVWLVRAQGIETRRGLQMRDG
jgi:hypothetical protein